MTRYAKREYILRNLHTLSDILKYCVHDTHSFSSDSASVFSLLRQCSHEKSPQLLATSNEYQNDEDVNAADVGSDEDSNDDKWKETYSASH